MVVDTNLFVSGIIRRGNPYQLIRRWREGDFLLLASDALRDELADVLYNGKAVRKYRVSREVAGALVALVEVHSIHIQPSERLPVQVRDPKDEMVLASALGGQADYLVTGDEDLLVLADDPRLGGLRIVTVRAFLDLLAPGSTT